MRGENDAHKTVSHTTVLSALIQSDLPPEELSLARLQDEGAGIVGAGIETTKQVLTMASFHLISNPSILQQLQQELQTAIPDPANPPSWPELEKLPYLTAVIQECKNVSPASLPRQNTDARFSQPSVSPTVQAHDSNVPPPPLSHTNPTRSPPAPPSA